MGLYFWVMQTCLNGHQCEQRISISALCHYILEAMLTKYSAEGYSSRGGQSRNPYNLAEHAGGSSSGSAISVATNMCAFSIGTETDSSASDPSASIVYLG